MKKLLSLIAMSVLLTSCIGEETPTLNSSNTQTVQGLDKEETESGLTGEEIDLIEGILKEGTSEE